MFVCLYPKSEKEQRSVVSIGRLTEKVGPVGGGRKTEQGYRKGMKNREKRPLKETAHHRLNFGSNRKKTIIIAYTALVDFDEWFRRTKNEPGPLSITFASQCDIMGARQILISILSALTGYQGFKRGKLEQMHTIQIKYHKNGGDMEHVENAHATGLFGAERPVSRTLNSQPHCRRLFSPDCNCVSIVGRILSCTCNALARNSRCVRWRR